MLPTLAVRLWENTSDSLQIPLSKRSWTRAEMDVSVFILMQFYFGQLFLTSWDTTTSIPPNYCINYLIVIHYPNGKYAVISWRRIELGAPADADGSCCCLAASSGMHRVVELASMSLEVSNTIILEDALSRRCASSHLQRCPGKETLRLLYLASWARLVYRFLSILWLTLF